MDDYLAKPLRKEDMIRCLDKWVRHGRGKGQEIGGSGRSGRDGKGRAGMSGTGDPIDLAKAMSEFDADRDFLKEILGGFLNNVRKQIELIRTALADGNADTIRREAHSIKGGAANICADDLSRAASDLELLGKGGNLDGARPMLQRLEEELIRLETFDREGL
jgi:HPt (histidine-containing phosphotransfer) domain-containing protein